MVCSLRSKFCCMESDRYKLTVLFLKTFFRSWALSVKLSTHRNRQQAHLMTHTSNLCLSTFSGWTCKLPLPAGTKHHVGRQALERQEGEYTVCDFVCEQIIGSCMLARSYLKTNGRVRMNGFMCINWVLLYAFMQFVSPHSLHVCFCTGMCECVCVCLQPTGSGTVARQGDHFQPAGDLTLICSTLMTAAGPRPQRAEQTWLN